MNNNIKKKLKLENNICFNFVFLFINSHFMIF